MGTVENMEKVGESPRLNLTTLVERSREDITEVFKILHGHDGVHENYFKLVSRHSHLQTRGHNLKLFKPSHCVHKRNMFFPLRVMDQWSSLPEVVTSKSTCKLFSKTDMTSIFAPSQEKACPQ